MQVPYARAGMGTTSRHQDAAARAPRKLPPGQHARKDFPRFGTHLHLPPPRVPDEPAIDVSGAVREPFTVPLGRLAALPRREQTSDLHCVSGWSAVGIRWEGVPFSTFYRELIEPQLVADPAWLVLGCLDGFRVVEYLEDALADDVLLADRLDGEPLDGDHGAPLRFVSPGQYGYVSAKHLSRIEVHVEEPRENYGRVHWLGHLMRPPLFWRHPRARVWHEERNPHLPNRLLMPFYSSIRPPIRWLSALGSRPRADENRAADE